MARSVWKGPFVEESLIKKIDKQKLKTAFVPIELDSIHLSICKKLW